jgi:hypothetical protein
MPDVVIERASEKLAVVSGETDEGLDFVDAYMGAEFVVIDSGRITLADKDVGSFIAACKEQGLTVERDTWPPE